MIRRTTEYIIVHCTDTKCDMRFDVKWVDAVHRQRGFTGIGYHYLVLPNGKVQEGRPLYEEGAHCKAQRMNKRSIGVCYVGGRDEHNKIADTRTEAQKRSLVRLLQSLRQLFPDAKIRGHYQFTPYKTCPNFDAEKEYENI